MTDTDRIDDARDADELPEGLYRVTGCRACDESPELCAEHAAEAAGPDDASDEHPNHDGRRAQELDYWTCRPCDEERFASLGDLVDPAAVPELIHAGAQVWSFGYGDDPLAFVTLSASDLWAWEPLADRAHIVASWGPFRSPATLPDGSDADGPRSCDACVLRTAEPGSVLCAFCAGVGEPLDPTDEAGIAELAAALAIPPLQGVGFLPADDLQRVAQGAVWASLLYQSAAHRRALERRAHLSRGTLWTVGAAHESGLVPLRDAIGNAQRVRELVEVGSSLASLAENARAWAIFDALPLAERIDPDRPRGLSMGMVDFRGWRGDIRAELDGSAERFELSQSGRWSATLPPIYAAGRAQSITARPGANRPV